MRNSLKIKMIVPVITVLLLLVIFIIGYVSLSVRNFANVLTNDRLESAFHSSEAYLKELEKRNRISTYSISVNHILRDNLVNWNAGINRPESREEILQYLNDRKVDLDIDAIVVLDINGNVVLRTHEPDRYGDSSLNVPTFAAVFSGEDMATMYYSAPSLPMALSSAAPIVNNGVIIGAVSAIVDMETNEFISNFAETSSAEISIFAGDTQIATTLANRFGNQLIGTRAEPDIVASVLGNGQAARAVMRLSGVSYQVSYLPLLGLDGAPVGMFSISFSDEYTLAATSQLQFNLVLIGILGSVIVAAIIFWLVKRTLKPLEELTANANEVARGNIAINFRADRKDEIGQVSKAFMEIVKTLHVLEESFVRKEYEISRGNIRYRSEESNLLSGIFYEILGRVRNITGNFVSVFDNITEPFIIIDKNCKILYSNKIIHKFTRTEGQDVTGMHINDFVNGKLAEHHYVVDSLRDGQVRVETEITLQLNPGQLFTLELNVVPYMVEGQVTGAMLLMTNFSHVDEMRRKMKRQNSFSTEQFVGLANNLTEALTEGHLDVSFDKSVPDDEDTAKIAGDFNAITDILTESLSSINEYIDGLQYALHEMANKNFNHEITIEYKGDFSRIKESVNVILKDLNAFFVELYALADSVQTDSSAIAGSAEEMSTGFVQQLEIMTDIRTQVGKIAQEAGHTLENTREAKSLSAAAKNDAQNGNAHMTDMLSSMENIRVSTDTIASIIKTIQDIAFQTNLLALNASVEAARAGEHGRGFSVVAEEVRNLASRVAVSVQESSDMIQNSIEKAEAGMRTAQETAVALGKIVEGVENIDEVIDKIVASSIDQNKFIEHVEGDVEKINEMIEDDVKIISQNADATGELMKQAEELQGRLGEFNLRR